MPAQMLTLVQLNDSHAYFDLHQEVFWEAGKMTYRQAGGYARIATLLGEIRAGNPGRVLFCDCGDTLHGTYPAVHTRGRAMVPILNALAPDAMTGHWEFAYGPETLKERIAALDTPMLAVNVYEQSTGKRFFPPYVVKELAGLRIGVLAVASNIVDKTMPPAFSKGIRFALGRDELPPLIERLRHEEKADLIVLISHLGFPQEMKLLSEVPGIDVCLGGHTHHRLSSPVRQGDSLLIQSGSHGSFLGRLDLDIDGGRIVDYRHQMIEVTPDIAPDPAVEALVRDATDPYRAELSMVVGETATALNRANMLEATMDNLLLQAMLEATGAQLAFSNGWRYGAPIVPGPVTLNDLYNMIPMNPPINTVQLTGEELVTMLEENLQRTFAADPYEQMGGYVKRCLGLTAYIKIENPPGHRIQHLAVGHETVAPEQMYSAAYVTEQGVPRRFGQHHAQHTDHVIDALRAYLARHRPAHAELRGTFVAV